MSANLFENEAFVDDAVAPETPALQQLGPRPLPLFLGLLQKQHNSDPLLAEKALIGLKRIQSLHPAHATITAPVVAQCGDTRLHDYGGSGPAVVFVPSLINPATILDIVEERSLLRWLSRQGLHPYLVNWGDAVPSGTNLSIAEHITERLLPLIAQPDERPHLVGYCLGGTMALAAAQLSDVRSLTLIASPWHFDKYPDGHIAAMDTLWNANRDAAARLGVLPIEMLQTLFWHLDPAGTIAKYAGFADAPASGAEFDLFIAMESWANSGAPLPYAAARELFDDFFASDLPGSGRWRVGSAHIAPLSVQCPSLEIVSSVDNIVPAATATQLFKRLEIDRGHVGMITGSQAQVKLWQPLREWLSQAELNG